MDGGDNPEIPDGERPDNVVDFPNRQSAREQANAAGREWLTGYLESQLSDRYSGSFFESVNVGDKTDFLTEIENWKARQLDDLTIRFQGSTDAQGREPLSPAMVGLHEEMIRSMDLKKLLEFAKRKVKENTDALNSTKVPRLKNIYGSRVNLWTGRQEALIKAIEEQETNKES